MVGNKIEIECKRDNNTIAFEFKTLYSFDTQVITWAYVCWLFLTFIIHILFCSYASADAKIIIFTVFLSGLVKNKMIKQRCSWVFGFLVYIYKTQIGNSKENVWISLVLYSFQRNSIVAGRVNYLVLQSFLFSETGWTPF